jgi:hypothetical protein
MAGGAALGAAVVHTGGAVARQAGGTDQLVHFGWVLGAENIIAVAFDSSAIDAEGARTVKAYVCDGHGNPDGIALWFKGSIKDGSSNTLTSADGKSTLVVDFVRPDIVTGAFTDAKGTTKRFASFRATAGAGIYDVTLDQNLRYSGTSTDGTVLDAQATEDGVVSGILTSAGGEIVEFTIHVLATAAEATLLERGLPTSFRDFAEFSIVPDSYTAVISPAGAFWLGRSGDIRGGSAGNNIIGLDQAE